MSKNSKAWREGFTDGAIGRACNNPYKSFHLMYKALDYLLGFLYGQAVMDRRKLI